MRSMLAGRNAVIFGGSGAIGSAVAHVLAREGARVQLGARHEEPLDQIAQEIRRTGGKADVFSVDALDEKGMFDAVAQTAQRTGDIDIVVNATGFMHDQGKELSELSHAEFVQGYSPFLTAQFNISKAISPWMGRKREGAFITVVAPAGAMAIPGHLGHIVACAGMEAFSKALASEWGPRNIRVLCLRAHAIAGAIEAGSYTGQLFAPKAEAMGLSVNDWLGGAAQATMLGRLPTLSQVAETIAFLSSHHAGAMTAATVNMTAGATVD